MKSFTDESGKTWLFNLTIGAAKRIAAKHKVDIVEGDPSEIFTELWSRPLLRMNIMWDMVVEKEGSTQDHFDESLAGKSITDANQAFWDELTVFFLSLDPSRAEAITQMAVQAQKASEKQLAGIKEMASNPMVSQLMDKAMDQSMKTATESLGNLFTKLQEESESSPTPSASGRCGKCGQDARCTCA